MLTLKSYICGRWHEASGKFSTLVNPSTGEEIARASSDGIDYDAVLAYARERGGPALRALSFAARGEILKAMSKVLRENREELLALSRLNSGTTESDGSFDIDGASGTLHYYASLAKSLGDAPFLAEGDVIPLSKSDAFAAQHVLVPRDGVAVHINAFNFPAWGFAEKAACALLAGMPVITKPATSTAMVTARCIELITEAGIVPEGALQFICGSTGDLLDRLGPQDVVAFTGSADTARTLRARSNLIAACTRFNVEADSLNAAVLADGINEGPVFDLFIRDVVREIRQKAGQKCTAVRRILAPAAVIDRVQQALIDKLTKTVVGNPAEAGVTMGPLATAGQLDDALRGIAELKHGARIVYGTGERCDGVGSPAGTGYFIAPTLLRADDAFEAGSVHEREVFGPVATLLPYDGSAMQAARIIALGSGTLVTSVYSDDAAWVASFLRAGGSSTGRVYIGSSESAPEAPGSGVVFPAALHGGPGRAGGGEELGGLVGVRLYMQRVAVEGSRALLAGLTANA